MATDGPTPAPCEQEILEDGLPLALLHGSSNLVENWVQRVAKSANARIDWHYVGGAASVLHLGDVKSRERAEAAINKLENEFTGTISSIYHLEEGCDSREYKMTNLCLSKR